MKTHAEKPLSSVALSAAENDSNAIIFIEHPKPESNNSEVIIQELVSHNIKHIFLVPGKLIYPFINAIDSSEIKGIVGAHETACGFMADGYARASRKFGVCLAISGPGTMNFIPAMAAAQADRIPVLYLAGGISTYHEAQGAFQDGSNSGLDELTIVKPLLNSAVEIKNGSTLKYELRRSLISLNTQRKGRAYLSMPVDIQKKKMTEHPQLKPLKPTDSYESPIDIKALEKVLKLHILGKSKVAILAGHRVNNRSDAILLHHLAEKYQIPVATTLSGKGAFSEEHALSLGVYGFAGHTRAVETINGEDVDVLIVFGCDLSQRDSLNWTPKLHGNKRLILIDEDFEKSCLHYQPDVQVFSNLNGALQHLVNAVDEHDTRLEEVKEWRKEWLQKINNLPLILKRSELPSQNINEKQYIYPGDAIKHLRQRMSSNTNVVVDSGAHRIFMAHYWQSNGCGDYHTSSSLAPMGWAVCAGIGIKLAAPENDCLVVTGDGCMLMHGMEIQTAARYGIKVIFVVMNNSAHGAMYIDTLHNRGISSGYTALPNHDWVAFAHSLGVTAARASTLEDLDAALDVAHDHDGPFLIEIEVGNDTPPNRYYADSTFEFEQRISNL